MLASETERRKGRENNERNRQTKTKSSKETKEQKKTSNLTATVLAGKTPPPTSPVLLKDASKFQQTKLAFSVLGRKRK